jgi:hypothetical protein
MSESVSANLPVAWATSGLFASGTVDIPVTPSTTWLNSLTPSSNVPFLYVAGSYQLFAEVFDAVPIAGFGNWDGALTNPGQTLSAIQTVVADFVAAAGGGWMVIGDITTGEGALAAVNLSAITGMGQSGNGISFNTGSTVTSGYAPYANYSDAQAAILSAMGNYSFL